MPLTLPAAVREPDTEGVVETDVDPLTLWDTDCVTVVHTVGDVVTDEDDEREVERVPVTEPDTLGVVEPVGELLTDTLRVPLTVPLTVRVPDEDAETEPLVLCARHAGAGGL